jgi:TetR/AcrR family acrAB operon transcriptional repressor
MGEDDGGKPNEERERRILEAAGRLIAHYGYDKTTVADIAQEAGISKGAIYLHFESKEDLFAALLMYETNRVLDNILQFIREDPEGGSFISLYRYALIALAANPLMKALTTRNKRILGDYIRQLSNGEAYARGKAFGEDFVKQFQEAGLLRADLSVDMIVYILSLVRYGLLRVDEVLAPEDLQPLDEAGFVLADILEKGLVPSEGGDKEAGKRIISEWLTQTQIVLEEQRRRTTRK